MASLGDPIFEHGHAHSGRAASWRLWLSSPFWASWRRCADLRWKTEQQMLWKLFPEEKTGAAIPRAPRIRCFEIFSICSTVADATVVDVLPFLWNVVGLAAGKPPRNLWDTSPECPTPLRWSRLHVFPMFSLFSLFSRGALKWSPLNYQQDLEVYIYNIYIYLFIYHWHQTNQAHKGCCAATRAVALNAWTAAR